MISYKEFEKTVFDWLISKNAQNQEFRFSVRKRSSKGAETDYFIGTANSNYFGTTLWDIPINFPGVTGDLIFVKFEILNDGNLKYYIEFYQTKSPENQQNNSALSLIQSIKNDIKNKIGLIYESRESNAHEVYKSKPRKDKYSSIADLLDDLDKDLEFLVPLINIAIANEKKNNPSFQAGLFSEQKFQLMLNNLNERINVFRVSKRPSKSRLATMTAPLNQILYGPPGTGKTYHTINKAIQIINPEFDLVQERSVIKAEFERLIKVGQIAFTTFHQSMSYEDFIEGIKPQKPKDPKDSISYDIEPGIFKRIAEAAKSNFESTKSQNQQKLTFEEALTHLMDEWDKNPEILFPLRTPGYEFTILGFSNTSIAFKNKNGGTSHSLSINTLKGLYYGTREFDFKQGVGIYYPSVLEKLRTYKNDKGDKNELLNFVLIIDEINRGNVSQIFGELITLIESDKRLGNKEALEVTLPYSKEPFSVPPNLYIIGTMNTADRSVEALDTALRRRFSFEEMLPNPKLISPGGLIWKLFWEYPKEPWDHLEYKAKEKNLFSFLGAIPHGVRICAKRYKKRVSKVRFESTKNQTTCLPSTSAKPTLNVQNTKDFIIL